MQLITLPLSKIKPYAKNPRNNDGAVDAVAESITQYGFNVPLVLDKDNVIICGHTRYKAAQQLGLEEVPCIVAADLSKKQAQAYRIADNKTCDFSFWDNKLLLEELEDIDGDWYTGFDFGDVETLLDEKDNSPITDADTGVAYEVVFRSESKEKIERIKELWESIDDEQGNTDS